MSAEKVAAFEKMAEITASAVSSTEDDRAVRNPDAVCNFMDKVFDKLLEIATTERVYEE